MRTAAAAFGRTRGEQLGRARRTDPPERRAFPFPLFHSDRSASLRFPLRGCAGCARAGKVAAWSGRARACRSRQRTGRPAPLTRGSWGRAILASGLVRRVLLASPRGYCAGVERAVDTVERALRHYGEPVYVRKQIVHNSHVVRELEGLGAIFVDSVDEIPEGSTVVFSAHGISPAVRTAADERDLTSIDATCPLVTNVHTQARRFAD